MNLRHPNPSRPRPEPPRHNRKSFRVGVLVRQRHSEPEPECSLHERLRELHATAFALSHQDDLGVLGLDPTATAQDIQRAYLELSKRYHPHRQARHGSEEARKIATEIYVRVQAAYGKLSGSHRVPPPEGGARKHTPRSRAALRVSEAIALLDYHQYDAALDALEAVLAEEPEHQAALLYLALAQARQRKAAGDLKAAAEAYRDVLEFCPDHPEATAELARLTPRTASNLLKRWLGRGD